MSFQCISVDEAKKIIDDNNLTIIDIRDYNSFLQGHIDNAIHVENLDIDSFINKKNKSGAILIYCYHGNSSKSAANFFTQHGFEKVLSMDEGYSGWIKD
jgi:thiosulfate sulfurtransferase